MVALWLCFGYIDTIKLAQAQLSKNEIKKIKKKRHQDIIHVKDMVPVQT